jgi:hypothetical protein
LTGLMGALVSVGAGLAAGEGGALGGGGLGRRLGGGLLGDGLEGGGGLMGGVGGVGGLGLGGRNHLVEMEEALMASELGPAQDPPTLTCRGGGRGGAVGWARAGGGCGCGCCQRHSPPACLYGGGSSCGSWLSLPWLFPPLCPPACPLPPCLPSCPPHPCITLHTTASPPGACRWRSACRPCTSGRTRPWRSACTCERCWHHSTGRAGASQWTVLPGGPACLPKLPDCCNCFPCPPPVRVGPERGWQQLPAGLGGYGAVGPGVPIDPVEVVGRPAQDQRLRAVHADGALGLDRPVLEDLGRGRGGGGEYRRAALPLPGSRPYEASTHGIASG